MENHLVVKIVRLYNAKAANTPFGLKMVRQMEIKDVNNDRQRLSIWQQHYDYDQLVENDVYFIKRIKVEKYPKEGPPFNLASLFGLIIKKASSKVSDTFKGVSLYDGRTKGVVEGIKNVALYEACGNCTSRCSPQVKFCGRCKKSLKNSRIPLYFR